MLAEQGYDGFNLIAVSQRAGVSYGAIYWYFADKEALLVAVHEQLMAELEAEAEPLRDPCKWADAAPREVVAAVVEGLGRVYAHRPELLRAVALHGGADPSVLARSTPAVRRLGDDIATVLVPHLERAGHPEPAQAAEELFVTVVAVLAAHVTWPGYFERPTIPWERLVARLREMVLADIDARIVRAAE